MDITLKQLQSFQAVVVTGSITKASRRVGLSQPSISQQLAKLEEKLGTQLIERNRTGVITLTPSGAYWFKLCEEMLRLLDHGVNEHQKRFVDNAVMLRIGVTPTLAGRFSGTAARIAAEEPGLVKCELRFALASAELVEQLRLHQLNCVIVDERALEQDRASVALERLFTDPLCWVIPSSVSDEEISKACSLSTRPRQLPGALAHYVEIDASVPLRAKSDEWFRHRLPAATPTYSTMTYAAAMDIVAEGLATSHCPLSLLPSLPPGLREKLRFILVDGLARHVAIAMPKHLMTLPAYANIFRKLVAFSRNEYHSESLLAETDGDLDLILKRGESPRRASPRKARYAPPMDAVSSN